MKDTASRIYWKHIAEEYDKIVKDKGDINHEQIINPVIFRFLGNLNDKIILDAGCGNGYLSRKIAKNAKKVIGVDFTEKLIKVAERQNKQKNVEFIVSNLKHLPFNDGFFDAVLCNMVLMDLENFTECIKELSRVLKKSGTLVASLTHPCFENPPRTYSLFDDNGKRIGRAIQYYFDTGLLIDNNQNVVKGQYYQHYHHTISDYLNAFYNAGFCLQGVSEPNGYNIIGDIGGMSNHAPTFIIMRYIKNQSILD